MTAEESVANVIVSPHIWPLAAVVGYLLYPKGLRINPSILHSLSITHNAALALYSASTFIALSQMIREQGLVFRHQYYFQHAPNYDTIIMLFYLSKYWEFADTFLLYLNGKTPIFLQKFHHIGAVICWHLHYIYKIDAVWLPTFANSFVHTIMYSYYLGCLLKIRQVRFLKQYITSLQLVQLVIPCFICLHCYLPPVETQFNYNLIILFVAYVCVLVVLFVQFYYDNYLRGPQAAKKIPAVASTDSVMSAFDGKQRRKQL